MKTLRLRKKSGEIVEKTNTKQITTKVDFLPTLSERKPKIGVPIKVPMGPIERIHPVK